MSTCIHWNCREISCGSIITAVNADSICQKLITTTSFFYILRICLEYGMSTKKRLFLALKRKLGNKT